MTTSLFRRSALILILVPALGAMAPDEGDDAYRFLVGLGQKGMHEMVVKEGESFLREHPRHKKTNLARYRLASALFELDRKQESAPHFDVLTKKRGFEYGTESWFRLALCRLEAENWRGAQQALEQVIAAKEEYLLEHARFLLADCAFQLDDFARAEKGYLDILRTSPRSRGAVGLSPGAAGSSDYARDAASGAAWCAWRLEKTDDAIERIEEFLSRFGDDPADGYADELRIVLGEARMRKEDPERALEAYGAVGDGPQKEAALRGIGFARADLGDHAGAARAFGDLLELDPRGRFALEAALFRGIHLLKANDAKAALEALARAGGGADVLFWTARAQEAAGQQEAALRTLDRALAAKPDSALTARIQAARGDVLFALGRGDEAVAAYERGGSDYALHAAAVAALNGGEADEAVRLAERLLKRFPESTYRDRTLLVLGEAHFNRARYAEAERVLTPLAASVSNPGQRVRALSRVAWCRYLSGDASGAAELFGRVASEHANAPEAEEALYMQGRAAEETGDAATAVRAWRRYVRDHPGGERCDRVLAGLARHEDLAQATKRVQRLLDEHPGSALLPQALLEHAERCSQGGKLDEAALHYRELLERFPDDGRAAGARYG
ncbi:MAG: tetratricopeptide repeat protein, partial [Planctomycetota bacterium]|nr:tetratricopeptide repeat protein [Planctomycetota bacterium]